jgi:cob(I)alamin adenosyltransferase
MPTSISTRTGDDGSTSLLYGQRVPKTHPQIEAVGAFDELNAALGVAKSTAGLPPARHASLERIQRELIALMGELACAEADAARYLDSKFSKLDAAAVARLDAEVVTLEAAGLNFGGWATPGGTPAAATLDVARTIARRAERRLHALADRGRQVRPLVAAYVNRAADLLWLFAREAETPPPAVTPATAPTPTNP